jgi:hypothetical protein
MISKILGNPTLYWVEMNLLRELKANDTIYQHEYTVEASQLAHGMSKIS